MLMRLIQPVAKDLLYSFLDLLVVDAAIGHDLQSLSLILGECTLSQNQVPKQMPASSGAEQIQTLLLQLSEGGLLVGEECRERLSTLSSSTEDRIVKGGLQSLISQVLVSIFNDLQDHLVSIIAADLVHSEVCQRCSEFAADRDAVDHALPNQVERQSGFCLDEPQLKIPVKFTILFLRIFSSHDGAGSSR